MSLNDTELMHVVESLQPLVGRSVANVWQPARDRVVLGLGDRLLLLVPRGPYARLHTVSSRPKNPANPFSFQGACRSMLRGPLTQLSKSSSDRVVDLDFGPLRLHLRLTGNSGGLWLVEGETVLAAFDGPAPDALVPLSERPGGRAPRPARFEPKPDEDWNSAARRWFSTKEFETRMRERRVLVQRRLRTKLERDRRLLSGLGRDLARADQVPQLRDKADALAAVLHTVPRGATEVVAAALDGSDRTWVVPLDPTKSAGDNLSRMYNKVRRLERAGDRILEHIDRVEKRIRTLDAALHVVDGADAALLRKLEQLAPRDRRREASPDTSPWHEWVGPNGERVLVGRNAAANRRLTFQRARGDDFWFHIRGRPGAHVLFPVQKGKTPNLETLLCVGQICLAHAKVSEGEAADVQYTRARHVRSIKGAADGRVMVHEERVIRVVRDPTALAGWSRDGDSDAELAGLATLTDGLADADTEPRFRPGDIDRP
ncbi:MAG: NFACT family protein [Myxococcota bacterium]